jgi:hypothetical protein
VDDLVRKHAPDLRLGDSWVNSAIPGYLRWHNTRAQSEINAADDHR